jgi:hypothetical protein
MIDLPKPHSVARSIMPLELSIQDGKIDETRFGTFAVTTFVDINIVGLLVRYPQWRILEKIGADNPNFHDAKFPTPVWGSGVNGRWILADIIEYMEARVERNLIDELKGTEVPMGDEPRFRKRYAFEGV